VLLPCLFQVISLICQLEGVGLCTVLYIIEKYTVHLCLVEAILFCVHHHDLMTPFYMGSSADDICGLLFDSL